MTKVRLFVVLLMFVAIATIGSVCATFSYPAQLGVSNNQQLVFVNFSEFEYTPEQVIPNDGTITPGENHVALLNNVTDHIKYGLNSDKKPIVNDLLQKTHGIVYSQQNVQGGNLKHMMITDSSMERLEFAIQYITDTEYHCYTIPSKYLTSGYIGQKVEVYQTVIRYIDGEWVSKLCYRGKAMVTLTPTSSSIISIDPATFVKD